MADHVFVGFGFGPIQGGLFGAEAFKSRAFRRMVVAEIDQALVNAVRENGGTYFVNVATPDGIETAKIDGVELLNPAVDGDMKALQAALREATEITTCLPSVSIYGAGGAGSAASLIAEALNASTAPATIIYAAENNNCAAGILREKVDEAQSGSVKHPVQYLNTVIGKMSRVVVDPAEIARMNLAPIAPAMPKAFLVEEFNRIFVTQCRLADFRPGIQVFIEKGNLIPFEEAKLYGHNAIHALLAYLGAAKGCRKMTDVAADAPIMKTARDAFLNESGAALIKKYGTLGDALFTEDGYREFAEDLMRRMVNPHLADTVDRLGRDPMRKLGRNDRIFGTMALALEHGIPPKIMAMGVLAALAFLLKNPRDNNVPAELRFSGWRELDDAKIKALTRWIWGGEKDDRTDELIRCAARAASGLADLVKG